MRGICSLAPNLILIGIRDIIHKINSVEMELMSWQLEGASIIWLAPYFQSSVIGLSNLVYIDPAVFPLIIIIIRASFKFSFT